jgi:hypothetical protein
MFWFHAITLAFTLLGVAGAVGSIAQGLTP